MKKILLTIAVLAGTLTAIGQPNPNANPFVDPAIQSSANPLEVGQTVTATFTFGNNGTDPVPAGGAQWNVSFPPNVTVDQASLNLTGPGFATSWNVMPGTGTFLTLVPGPAGVPPGLVIQGTVQLTGASVGTDQMTINALPNPGVAQNTNPGDDNAARPFQVVAAGTLPVHLLSFRGRLTDKNTARLDWKVANADKFSHYELERSVTGKEFSKVVSVKHTAQQEYRYDDDISSLKGQKVWYRLRMVDMDGSFSLSPMVLLETGHATAEITAYPNPATGSFTVTGIRGIAEFTLVAMDGRLLQSGKLDAARPEIDIKTLPAGAFLFNIVSEGQQKTIKMIRK